MIIQINGLSLQSNATDLKTTKGGFIAAGPRLTLSLPTAPTHYLISGWQSWSLTTWVNTNRPIHSMRPSMIHSGQTDPVHARDMIPNGSWYGAVKLADKKIIFLGALGLESHVALDGPVLTGSYESGVGEWFIAGGDENEFMTRYAEILKDHFGGGGDQPNPSIWCSWYSLYTEIYEQRLIKILNDLGAIGNSHGLPFDIFQIDDGWQVRVGEWEPNRKFPSGMDSLAEKIKKTGRKAGLWLAPLLAVPTSSIYKDHKDWLLLDKNGKPVSAGFNWGEQLFALDTTRPAVLDWLSALMKRVRGWGYDYIKLDFLYAGALPGKRAREMPRENAYRKGLKVMREALGDAYLLTCGAPILPSIGLCDGMRVGPDVAGHFSSYRDDSLLLNFAIPGARNALRTTCNRLWLKSLVQTDPDVVYFSSRQNILTAEQKSLLQDLAEICEFKASSDVPAWMTDSERSALSSYLAIKAKVRRIGQTSYQIGTRKVDFGPYIGMPNSPGMVSQLEGAVVGALANIPFLMKVFDKLGKNKLKKMLKANPV